LDFNKRGDRVAQRKQQPPQSRLWGLMMPKKQWYFYIAVLGALVPVVLFVLWIGLAYVIYVKYNISNDDIEKYLSYGFFLVLYLSNGIGVLLPGYLTKRKLRVSFPVSFYLKTVFFAWLVLSVLWVILEKFSRHVEVNGKTLSLFFAFNFIVCSIIGFYSGKQAEKHITAPEDARPRLNGRKTGFVIKGAIAVALAVAVIGYSWFRYSRSDHWTPTAPEPPAKVFFEAPWGAEGVGIYKASGEGDCCLNEGFQNFFIKGSRVYIADIIKREISVFENNKLVRTYPYPAHVHIDLGMAISDEFIFMLDDGGNITKINIDSGHSTVQRHAIVENEYGILAVNSFTLYLLNDILIADALMDKDRCFSTADLSETTCPFNVTNDPETEFVYLRDGFHASVEGSNAWLYDAKGKKVGRVRDIDKVNLIYDAGRNCQIDMNGVYYAGHFDAEVKIYFKLWQR